MIAIVEHDTQAAAAVPPALPPRAVGTVEPADGYRKVLLGQVRRAIEAARRLR